MMDSLFLKKFQSWVKSNQQA